MIKEGEQEIQKPSLFLSPPLPQSHTHIHQQSVFSTGMGKQYPQLSCTPLVASLLGRWRAYFWLKRWRLF